MAKGPDLFFDLASDPGGGILDPLSALATFSAQGGQDKSATEDRIQSKAETCGYQTGKEGAPVISEKGPLQAGGYEKENF